MSPVNSNEPPPSPDDLEGIVAEGDLLKRFIERHDETAFERLVRSHGPMVLGVCRRVIGNPHDAEDAFQATFLVFARKARSICVERTIAGWLYGVAYRTALKARNLNMKKKSRETSLPDDLEAATPDVEQWSALRPLLDQELNRLPEQYRLPLVLCYLEGKTYGEAAAQLGCPEGTLSVRLMRARTKLADFLRRRGLVLSVAALGSILTCAVAAAGTPSVGLTASTVKAASAFAISPTSATGLISSEVATLSNSVLRAIQLPRIMATIGTTASATGLLAVGLGGWLFSGGSMESLSASPIGVVMEDSKTGAPSIDHPVAPPENKANSNVAPTDAKPESKVPEMNGKQTKDPDAPTKSNSDSNVNDDVAGTTWGSIRGRVVVKEAVGPLPPLVRKLNPGTKDFNVCAANDIPDESLVFDPDSGGLANVVVWLARRPDTIHPDLVESKEKEVAFDQLGCRFIPHVMLVRTDQRVRNRSNDAVAHNTHTYSLKNATENFIVAPNDRNGVLIAPMTLEERLPFKVGCDIHPWMQAYWLVLSHPYAAITDKQGQFEIANLPVGEHEFRVWQERAGYLEKSYKVTVKPGKNLLPTIEVPTEKFKL